MAEVKSENATIKVEGQINSDAADDDAFEDDTDLQIPDPNAAGQAWLIKTSKELWKAWKQLYDAADDTPFEIGKLRVYHPKTEEERDPLKQKLEIVLPSDNGLQAYKGLPKNYKLSMKTSGYSNTVVFSEKDLPHRRSYNRDRQQQKNFGSDRRSGGMQAKTDRYGRPLRPGTFRTTIPKHTALAPPIQHEAVAQATDESSYAQLAQKWEEHLRPKTKTEILSGIDRRMHPGAGGMSTFSNFVTTSQPAGRAGGLSSAQKKKSAPREKAVRMEFQDLLDALYKCFQEYEYWTMKALRAKLRQPEAWIKSVLEHVAFLTRSGPFAQTYQLKPEFKTNIAQDHVKREIVKEEELPEVASGDETAGVTGDEDGDVDVDDFEDVKMEG